MDKTFTVLRVAQLGITLFFAIGWAANFIYLCHCDFQPPYKVEILRTVGVLVPPIGGVLGWVSIEDDSQIGQ